MILCREKIIAFFYAGVTDFLVPPGSTYPGGETDTGMIIIRTPTQNDNNKSRRENSGDFERIIRTEKKIGF